MGMSRHIYWKIVRLNREARSIDHPTLFLDLSSLSESEATEFYAVANTSAIIKYRSMFSLAPEVAAGPGDAVSCFSLHNYFEDDAGKQLEVAEFFDLKTGRSGGVVLGNSYSVLRNGPADMASCLCYPLPECQ